nr:NAD-binding protein [Schlegelella koreensis]
MSFASRVTHLGATGSGQVGKACNQMISFGTCAVLAEALHLAARLGLDVARLPQAIEGGLADSAVLRRYAPQMLGGELIGSSFNALKDLEIALELGRSATAAMPMTGVLASLHRLVVARGHHALGMAGPLRLYTDEPLVELAAAHTAATGGNRP